MFEREHAWSVPIATAAQKTESNQALAQNASPSTSAGSAEQGAEGHAAQAPRPPWTTRKPTWSDATPEGRWRPYTNEEILTRDKVSLDLFWLRDESLEDSANLPDPHLLAQEIADDLRSALAQIEDVLGDLEQRVDAGAREEA